MLGTAACGHSDLYAPTYPANPPLGSGVFHRITYDPGDDLFPRWLPGGDSVTYASTASDDATGDRCHGLISAEGGTRRSLPCPHHAGPDSVTESNWPAAAADGRVAFIWEPIRPYPSLPFPDSALLFIQSPVPGPPVVAFRFPHAIPGVGVYHGLSYLAWLNPDTLVAVAVTNTVIRDADEACTARFESAATSC